MTEYKTTETQRAKGRRCRDKRRAEQRCTRCGRQDARTLAGYACCERCRARLREYNDEHRAERQGQHIEYMRQWREARRGRAPVHGVRAAAPGGRDAYRMCGVPGQKGRVAQATEKPQRGDVRDYAEVSGLGRYQGVPVLQAAAVRV